MLYHSGGSLINMLPCTESCLSDSFQKAVLDRPPPEAVPPAALLPSSVITYGGTCWMCRHWCSLAGPPPKGHPASSSSHESRLRWGSYIYHPYPAPSRAYQSRCSPSTSRVVACVGALAHWFPLSASLTQRCPAQGMPAAAAAAAAAEPRSLAELPACL